MLEDSIKTQLRDVLGRLTRPVAVTAFVDDSQGRRRCARSARRRERLVLVELT